jgi:caffeoyl-CoA O-methyltransferase
MKLISLLIVGLFLTSYALAQGNADRDKKIAEFLQQSRQEWRDLNVPFEDGKILHDIIVDNDYQSALEIGTSTGHSTIWLAWALSKTGGKLVTIEMDEGRQKQAKHNIEQLGLGDFVDFKLGNAHQIVKELEGPFDFVFSDADKDWYVQYFKDIHPKLKKGGTFTAHNVLQRLSGIGEYLDYVQQHTDYQTHIDKTSSSGIAISKKK